MKPMTVKKAQSIITDACVYDTWPDLETSIVWLQQDDDLDEIRNRLKVAISEAESLLDGLYQAQEKIGASS